ncbi:MAG TPA: PDZ domain-containing protein [Phycisphaerae bacterium]|nr:PDZ domain-containing protein [Phycisphaerae bacterium]
MRKAIPMSALLAALLAMPAMADGIGHVVITPDGMVISDANAQADQMQQLQRRITEQVQARLARQIGRARVELAQYVAPGQGQLMFAPGPAAKEKAAYMGVATGPVPAVLRDQLKLHRGMGLVVLYVEKGAPAAEAGLEQNDVLEKFDDQLLVNGPQLAVLVRSKQAGDAVKLGIIRGGQRTTVTVKLMEKEVPVMEDDGGFRVAPAMPLGGGGEGAAPWQHGLRKTIVANGDGSMVRRLVNGEYDITLETSKEGVSTVVVKDRDGKEIYDGPYTTAKEKSEVPAEVAPLVKDLEQVGQVSPGDGAEGTTSRGEITRVDSKYRITLKRDGNEKHLTVAEVDAGKVLYDGPADSEEVKKLPQEIQDKVKALEEKARMQP